METITFDGKEYVLAEFISKLSDDSKTALFEALGAETIPYDMIKEEVLERTDDWSDEMVDKAVDDIHDDNGEEE